MWSLRIGIGIVMAFVIMFGIQTCLSDDQINRASFPKGFVFGTASSAYQYEGAVKEDGRGKTVWDTFSHTFGKVLDFSNGDVAVDQYHRYKEDIQLMKEMGMDAYRLSIAWSRIFPNGTGQINQAGIDHYNNLIDALLEKGIEPYVTIYHWDLPQALEDKYGGWLDPQIIEDFALYAETCFEKFGDRVKHWITFNEPHTFATQGYDVGLQAPGRCSILLHLFCRQGNSATEPYLVAHHTLLSHAKVTDIYRKKYKQVIPPRSLKQHKELKIFSLAAFRDGKPIGERANSIWLYIVPEGMRSLMNYIKHKYGNPPVIITENGMDDGNSPFTSLKDALKDEKRIRYYNGYLSNLLAAIRDDGCNVKGYFAWSLLDNWEWAAGFSSRFGLYYVDYNHNLTRYAKDSVQWFKKFLIQA
ncbi:Glycoside hydrolase family 1 [Dillenia turbinata]|uniref:Glycoside hydrolase family 1 n=1 Tax=Dillenia turbinata TaxID=194707 RepID=A0AAN8VBV8_9MAGN